MSDLVTVLMPTKADAATIERALWSVITQTYENWEAIVIDDNDDHVLRDWTKHEVDIAASDAGGRIRYIRSPNPGSGQLAAMAAALPFVHGDFVTMLHSDDELVDPLAFARLTREMQSTGAEAVHADQEILDVDGRLVGVARSTFSIPLMLATLGSNTANDCFFVTRKAFNECVVPNYIEQNRPYYFGEGRMLKLTKSEIPWYGYTRRGRFVSTLKGRRHKIEGQLTTMRTAYRMGLAVIPAFAVGRYTVAKLLYRLGLLSVRLDQRLAHRQYLRSTTMLLNRYEGHQCCP